MMKEGAIDFINQICLSEGLSNEIKKERIYAVIMYMLNVEKSISVEEAERILDDIRSV